MQSASVALMINPNLLGRHTAGKGERQKPSGLKSAYPDFRAASRGEKVGILWLFQKAVFTEAWQDLVPFQCNRDGIFFTIQMVTHSEATASYKHCLLGWLIHSTKVKAVGS